MTFATGRCDPRHWSQTQPQRDSGMWEDSWKALGTQEMKMPTTLDPRPGGSVTLDRPTTAAVPTAVALNGFAARPLAAPSTDQSTRLSPASHRLGVIGIFGLRLAIGFEFLWAFLDKVFGLGFSTTSAHAWINGGSPTTGFLSGANVGPFQGIFRALAGVGVVDWLFMLGLLGVGVAIILGVALRPAAIAGAAMLFFMYLAVWPFATLGGGQPTGSTNPIVDEHIIAIFGLVVIGAFAAWSVGTFSRRWASLPIVRSHSWLR
jgi:thiosulfate dehydrogenase [quinone] large subunit